MKIQYLILFALVFLNSCKDVESRTPRKSSRKPDFTPKKSIGKVQNVAFPLEQIFGIWTESQNDPHASFEITKDYFYFVDYDGNGEMQYEMDNNRIKIFYDDYELVGLIKKAQNDSLVIYWADGNFMTYTRWTQ